MVKRLSQIQKEEIGKLFINGKPLQELAIEFECTKLTISRNLKKSIGEQKFNELIKNKKSLNQNIYNKELNTTVIGKTDLKKKIDNKLNDQDKTFSKIDAEEFSLISPFVEITPLEYEIDNSPQKDLSSVSISDINFPKIVYMIVDKKIELEIKYLKDFPKWEFLSQNELNRKTIEIYFDLKNAKRICNKEQKVIKVTNTDVFKIVAPILLSRGISRIVSEDKLIAL